MKEEQRRKNVWTKWRDLVSEQRQSGQSVTAFCRARRLSASYFFQWKKKLSGAQTGRFVEVKMAAASPQPAAAGAGIEVRLKNDLRLLVQPGFDANHLQALLAILESRA
jgi:hypothetical protein